MTKKNDAHTTFLNHMVAYSDSTQAQTLGERLRQAHAQVRSCRRAILLAVVMGGLALAGLCFGAALEPAFIHRHVFLVQCFSVVLLASLISTVGFLGTWLWYRALRASVHDECRKLVMRTFDTQYESRTRRVG